MMISHIHGRFQPFHREHADYARWAAEDCDTLIVGITNADPSHIEPESEDPKRHKPKHNPFTYYERHRMISNFLEESQINCGFFILPFPINKPELLDHYAPRNIKYYINILESWHETKAERLANHGRDVVTKKDTRTVSSESIRERMASGKEWKSDVPEPVADYIDQINGRQRVSDLYSIDL